ncbi:heme O synthase protoheme IX farnesyltransferase [Nonlabens ulvanivorans]|nr:heme O synthase protoheme IX farnesyltransferase [Nonlabens ulvanivorans]
MWTISISLIPAFGVTGSLYMTWVSAVLVGLLGLWFLYYAINFLESALIKWQEN